MSIKDMRKFVPKRWKTYFALVLAVIAFSCDLLFIWGLFCLFWGSQNIKAKEAYFVERIERKTNPILYWIIIAIWVVMGGLYIYFDGFIRGLLV